MKNLSLTYHIQSEIKGLIFSDQKRLSQVLYNLIGNALKFTLVGEIKIQVKIAGNMVGEN